MSAKQHRITKCKIIIHSEIRSHSHNRPLLDSPTLFPLRRFDGTQLNINYLHIITEYECYIKRSDLIGRYGVTPPKARRLLLINGHFLTSNWHYLVNHTFQVSLLRRETPSLFYLISLLNIHLPPKIGKLPLFWPHLLSIIFPLKRVNSVEFSNENALISQQSVLQIQCWIVFASYGEI